MVKEEFDLPPGVADGQKLKIKGLGHASDIFAGVSGDLLLTVKVKPHELFQREGLNIVSEVPLSLTQAILGCTVTVDTLDGKMNVEVSPGVSDGEELTLKNLGVQPFHTPENYDVNSLRGDHIIRIKVIMPKALSEKQRELLRKFQ